MYGTTMQRMGFVPAIDKIEILKSQVPLRTLLYTCNILRNDRVCLTFDTQVIICKIFSSDLNLFN